MVLRQGKAPDRPAVIEHRANDRKPGLKPGENQKDHCGRRSDRDGFTVSQPFLGKAPQNGRLLTFFVSYDDAPGG